MNIKTTVTHSASDQHTEVCITQITDNLWMYERFENHGGPVVTEYQSFYSTLEEAKEQFLTAALGGHFDIAPESFYSDSLAEELEEQ